jgi:hypothetical protein
LFPDLKAVAAQARSALRSRLAEGAGSLLWIVAALVAALVYQFETGVNRPAIRSDGVGYYSYLPLYLIRHTLDFSVLPINHAVYGFAIAPQTGRMVDLYPVGTALCMAPFFLAGQAVAMVGGWPADGSSAPYQWAIRIAALCWFAVGAWATWQLVAARAGPMRASVALALLVLGTNLLHYVVGEPSMSHVYAFGTVGILFWLADRFWQNPRPWLAAAMGFAAGLLMSIRAYDILLASIALYPALWRSNRGVVRRNFLPFAAGMALALLPHFAIATYYMGAPWRTPYGVIWFHWGDPRIFTNLLSVERGWWFWSPVAAIGVGGLVAGLFSGKLRWFCGASLISMAAITYILASWGDPAVGSGATFGAGFGHRMYVDLLPCIAVGLAVMFARMPRPVWLLLGLNLYLTLAYWNGDLPQTGTTWSTFVRTVRQPVLWALGIAPPSDSRTPKGLSAAIGIADTRWDGGMLVVDVSASNTGTAVWLAEPGKGHVVFAIRTFGNSRCTGPSLGDWRFPIGGKVVPGQTVRLSAGMSKATLASQRLEYFCGEMMAEDVAWFRDLGPDKAVVFRLDGDKVDIPSALFPAIPFGRALQFSSAEVEPMLGDGWGGAEPGFRWTDGPDAAINFRTSPGRRLLFRLEAHGITRDGSDQVVQFRANTIDAGTFRWAKGESKTIQFAVVPDVAGNVSIELKIFHPLPKGSLPGDSRMLGLAVTSIQLVAADKL